MTERREHYIGDEIDRALTLISEESDEWDRRGRHVSEIDFDVRYGGHNYITVEVNE